MPKCVACGSRYVERLECNVDYLWLYHCLDCGHAWYKSKHAAPGIKTGVLNNGE